MSDKPHGPVGEQQMRRFYGPSGYIKDGDGGQATPHADLIAQILDSCVPKNEREHAAAEEIERLREGLSRMTQAVGLATTIKGEMPIDVNDPVGMMQEVVEFTGVMSAEIEQLREERDALRKMLLEASDEISDWGSYASEYFQNKHDLAGTIKRVRDAALKESRDE